MPLIASNKTDYQLPPADSHIARCYQVVDMGTTFSQFYGKSGHHVRIFWELPNATMEDGRPFTISKRYTLSLHEKSAMRKHLESWRGRKFTNEEAQSFDLTKLLGATCLLNVVHNERDGQTQADITSIMALPKGMPECPPPINPVLIFDLGDFDQAIFGKLSQGLRDRIGQSQEYKALFVGGGKEQTPQETAAGKVPFDDDIPW